MGRGKQMTQIIHQTKMRMCEVWARGPEFWKVRAFMSQSWIGQRNLVLEEGRVGHFGVAFCIILEIWCWRRSTWDILGAHVAFWRIVVSEEGVMGHFWGTEGCWSVGDVLVG